VNAPPPQGRPGRSRWPEADKIRHLFGARCFDHDPLPGHGPAPYWPRAEFGLPLQFQFQRNPRPGAPPYPKPTPPNVQLGWAPATGAKRADRLASPLILKPVQLADGRVAPLALWLNRTLPPGAQVGLVDGDHLQAGTTAPLGAPMPASDKHLFTPLAGSSGLREAFLAWVAGKGARTGGTL